MLLLPHITVDDIQAIEIYHIVASHYASVRMIIKVE